MYIVKHCFHREFYKNKDKYERTNETDHMNYYHYNNICIYIVSIRENIKFKN